MDRTAETSVPGSEEGPIPWSPWRVAAYARWEELNEALGQVDDRASDDYRVASERLETARKLVAGSYGADALRLYYSGAHIERTWASLHAAERRLIGLLDAAALSELLPPLRDDVERFVTDETERQRALEQLDSIRTLSGKPSRQVRDDVRALAAEVNKRSDLYWREVRAFRNLLVVISTLLLAVLGAAAIVQAVDSSLVSLCATPDAVDGEALCPIGDQPGATDIAVIELLGMLGGLLAAILPLAKAQRVPGPYGVAVAQTVLKGITGAGAAFVGVLLLQGELLVGFEPQGDSRLLAYAVFFGFAQHVLTRLVDQRANEIAKEGQQETTETLDGTTAPSSS